MTEKKTIGAFIAVLRKANGMTQRELAEMLNVSDKAVSRWERDECAPDLSLIPVIAEIFNITADELLRGERKTQSGETGEASAEESVYIREKSTRQFQNLLRTQLMRLRERSMISLGIMLAGFITALICNFVFTKAVLGFFLALIFYAAALIAEICFLRRAKVDEDDAYDYGKWLVYQNNVTKLGIKTFFTLWILLGITLPLLYTIVVSGINAGLEFGVYFVLALIFGFIFLVAGHIMDLYFIQTKLSAKGLLFLTEVDKENLKGRRKLFKKVSLISGISAPCLVLCAAFAVESVSLFAKPLRFDDYASFKEYMETDTTLEGEWHYFGYSVYDHTGSEPIVMTPNDEEEEPSIHTIEDRNGNVLCEYENKRDGVMWFEHSFDKSPDGLPIYVMTDRIYRKTDYICSVIGASLLILAAADVLTAAVIYVKKSKKYA
jgi:transcriptional regulator with XRE-family HTH domain